MPIRKKQKKVKKAKAIRHFGTHYHPHPHQSGGGGVLTRRRLKTVRKGPHRGKFGNALRLLHQKHT